MSRPSNARSCLLVLLALAFLVARVSGVHLHLCLDGSEPFASVHMLDPGEEELSAGLSATHHDEEIFPIADAVSKSKIDLDLTAMVAVVFVLLALLQLPGLIAPERRAIPAASRVRVFLPPSRGPPRH